MRDSCGCAATTRSHRLPAVPASTAVVAAAAAVPAAVVDMLGKLRNGCDSGGEHVVGDSNKSISAFAFSK